MTDTTTVAIVLSTPPADILEQAQAFGAITTPQELEAAAALLEAVVALEDEIGVTFDRHIKNAFTLHRDLCAQKRESAAPVLEAKAVLKRLVVDYEARVERQRKAEASRIEAMGRSLLTAQRDQDAKELREAGEPELADRILETPLAVPAAAVPLPAKPGALISRESWTAEVVDLLLLVRHVASHPDLLRLLQPNIVALNQQARSLHEHMNLPGVRAVPKPDIAVKRQRR